jgi:hypothetical protein
MHTVRHDFSNVTTYSTKRGFCPRCGKPTTRSMKFTHTVNPFNKNSEGFIKTREEVRADTKAEAEAWEPDFSHKKGVCAE